MAFNYGSDSISYSVALLVQEGPYKDSAGKRHCTPELKPFGTKIKVNTCTCNNFVLGRLKKMEKLGFYMYMYL